MVGCLLGIALTAATGVFQALPAQAATTYQVPCQPWRLVGYDFGQYVSGAGYHAGQDVCGPAGTPVYATASGQVMYSAKTPDSYRWGNLIMIQHVNPDGSQITSIYGHLSADRRVAAGQSVAKGQLIGFIGPAWTPDNGNWAAHLHFEIKLGGYGTTVGRYDPGVVGYASAQTIGRFTNPSTYVGNHQGAPAPPPPPAPRPTPPPRWEFAPIGGVFGTGAHETNSEFDMVITLRNTGNTRWSAGGAHPVRIGTSRPNDRGSAFSAGEIGRGWISPNRIALPYDVAPGGTVAVKVKMNTGRVAPGYYKEYFTPVAEGTGWLPDRGVYIGINVVRPPYASTWVGQGIYKHNSPTDRTGFTSDYLTPSSRVNAKVYIRNDGRNAWTSAGGHPVRLATARPHDRGSGFAVLHDGSIPASENWISPNRASGIDGRLEQNGSITPTDTINPGETAVFSFSVKGLPQSGSFQEYFQPVIEGSRWLDDDGIWYRFQMAQPGYHYRYVDQANPDTLALAGDETPAAIDLRNTGQTPWPVNGSVRLGTDRTPDHPSAFKGSDWLSPSRPSTIDTNLSDPAKSTVDPGEVARFKFNLHDPARPDGQYPEYVRPVVEGVTWFKEDYGVFLPIRVQSPTYDYQVISQKYDRDPMHLKVGDDVVISLVVRNIGRQDWQTAGTNAVHLGTARPNDRGSAFAVTQGVDPWPSSSRASGVDGLVSSVNPLVSQPAGQIKQGELALFRVPMHVSDSWPAPGFYREYFNLVAEGVSWMPDYGIFFPINFSR